jgi:hypothetical protein
VVVTRPYGSIYPIRDSAAWIDTKELQGWQASRASEKRRQAQGCVFRQAHHPELTQSRFMEPGHAMALLNSLNESRPAISSSRRNTANRYYREGCRNGFELATDRVSRCRNSQSQTFRERGRPSKDGEEELDSPLAV